MKKILLFSVLYLSSILCVFANQNDSIQIVELQQKVNDLKVDIRQMQLANQQQEEMILTISSELSLTKAQLAVQDEHIDSFTNKVGTDIESADKKIDDSTHALSTSIQQYTFLLWIGIVVVIALIAAGFLILRKKIKSSSSSFESIKEAQEKLKSTQESIEEAQKVVREESVKMDNKLVELLEKQIVVQPQKFDSSGTDHSLALKVADEIVRIEMNLSRMDESVKGYKQLKKAVEHIRTNFLAYGYEIVEMLGKPYNEGMRVSVNFVSDETLKEGEQVITGIIKPQINYHGKMIQAAQITVSQN